jgi:periplasmic protein TonB
MWSLPASRHLPGVAFLQLRKSPARNLDAGPASAGRTASGLGVGHFTVPPDVIGEGDVSASWSTIGTIVVPHGIAAVPRRSPIKARKRTPWNSAPEAHGPIERADHREWFSDGVFVESKHEHLPAAWTTSAMVHTIILILVLLLLGATVMRADLPPRAHMRVSLRMPAFLSPLPVVSPSAQVSVERPSLVRDRHPAPPSASEIPAAAPLETPSSVEAEPSTIDEAPGDSGAIGVEVGGTTDGVAGGVAGGSVKGSPVVAPAADGPLRVGDGIARPRKVKDVRPVYPLPAMAARSGGSVLIEATIGTDGKVHDARVLQSAAAFDQAALDAVRQWEYEPSRVNGVAVAVTMIIVVTFALL